jgi:hypothetical protein
MTTDVAGFFACDGAALGRCLGALESAAAYRSLRSVFVIYQDPLAYLLGLEGIALLDAWAVSPPTSRSWPST